MSEQIADEMRHLELYFYEEWKRGRRMVELYELVQHAGNIVPRSAFVRQFMRYFHFGSGIELEKSDVAHVYTFSFPIQAFPPHQRW
jgi:hypothetical protein